MRNHRTVGFAVVALVCGILCALSFRVMPATANDVMFESSDMVASSETTTWSDFRGSPTNNAITDAETPITTDDAGLLWAVQFENGNVSPAIIIDDEVVVTSGRGSKGTISKLDKETGKTIAEASMKNGSTYSLIPPTYADGKIFVTLSGGSMEAFDAKTLKSLWYYENKAGGQGNCPVVYSDGYVYTGYWSGESAERSFVCLDSKTGKLIWERSNVGGYYWAGAIAIGDYLLFGCDDGKPSEEVGTSYVRCVDKATGKDVSSVQAIGDQRSTIVYDSDLERVYFTSKAGYLYSARFDAETGALSDALSLKIDVESTATPLVYGGRVYVGSSSGGFAEGAVSVVDAETLKLLYKLDGKSGIGGSVKSAPLLSTAYEDADESDANGKLYLYLTTNYPPGGVTMLVVEPNSTKASQAKAVDLFTPPAVMQQYCIVSVICDNEGNLYYRNDSNYLMCIGPGGIDPADFKEPSSDDSKENGNSSGSSDANSSASSSSSSSGKKKSSSAAKSSSSSKSNTSASKSSSASDSGSTSSSEENASNGDGTTRRGNAIQYGGVRTTAANGSSSSGSAKSSSSSSSSSSSASSKATSKGADAAAKADTTTQSSTRHTDAVAATEHLNDTSNEGAPSWLVPAIVAGVAIAGFALVLAARTVASRRDKGGFEGVVEDPSFDAIDGSDGPYER